MVTALIEGTHQGEVNTGLVYAGTAWDAWFDGRELPRLRVNGTSRCRLLGTPFALKGQKHDVA